MLREKKKRKIYENMELKQKQNIHTKHKTQRTNENKEQAVI